MPTPVAPTIYECRRIEWHRALVEEAVEAAREAARLYPEDQACARRRKSFSPSRRGSRNA